MYTLVTVDPPIKFAREIVPRDGTAPLTHRLSQALVFSSIEALIEALRAAPAVDTDCQNKLTIRRVTQTTRWLDDGPVR